MWHSFTKFKYARCLLLFARTTSTTLACLHSFARTFYFKVVYYGWPARSNHLETNCQSNTFLVHGVFKRNDTVDSHSTSCNGKEDKMFMIMPCIDNLKNNRTKQFWCISKQKLTNTTKTRTPEVLVKKASQLSTTLAF